MKLEKFKEVNRKKIGIILFTITCILLISGVILYRTFAIFQVNETQNMIEGTVQDMGDVEFAFYIDGSLSTTVPDKKEDYSLDTSASKCIDMVTGNQTSNVNWDNENWEVRLKNISTTKTKCYLYFKKIYKEEILKGAIPDLGNGRLVPINILSNEAPTDSSYSNGNSGKVEKADITEAWYSYQNKQWANAVILKDGKVDNYQPGDEILESDIESYFVWIPRYRYQLKENESVYNGYSSVINLGQVTDINDFYTKSNGNKGATQAFEIQFETKNDGTKTGSTKGTYITHPAFSSFDSNGFWIGKFETGYDGATETTSAEINEQKVENIIIKPNVYSWRGINVSNAFYTSYNYQRELESHLMKNSEWGAVAYLAQSKYGTCKDGKCTEVRINNSASFVTGYSASFDPTCGNPEKNEICNKSETVELNKDGSYGYSYYNISSQLASTTGNYYGVYDMVGSAWEFVMGVLQSSATDATPASGRSSKYNSGFKGPYTVPSNDNTTETENTDGFEWPSKKYYDLYDYGTTNQDYQRGHLGDATKESGPFYTIKFPASSGSNAERIIGSYNADQSRFIYLTSVWFVRGGGYDHGTETGVNSFGHSSGSEGSSYTFRIILTP